jgi:short-subunit dehydrogenase
MPKVSLDTIESGVDDGLGPEGVPHAGDRGLVGHRRRPGRGAGRAGCCGRHLDAVDKLAVDVLDAFGGIDLLVNNAGIPKRRHVTALDIDTITAVMHVNYLSPMRLTMDLLPQMLARGSGTIVNISSVAATLSAPGEAAYDASKAALTAFSEAMAVDLWDNGIKVMVVYPGVIDTELFTLPDNDVPDLPVAAEPVSVCVDAILAGLESGAAQVYVPEWFHGVAASKAQDVGKFIEGTAAYLRDQKQKKQSQTI